MEGWKFIPGENALPGTPDDCFNASGWFLLCVLSPQFDAITFMCSLTWASPVNSVGCYKLMFWWFVAVLSVASLCQLLVIYSLLLPLIFNKVIQQYSCHRSYKATVYIPTRYWKLDICLDLPKCLDIWWPSINKLSKGASLYPSGIWHNLVIDIIHESLATFPFLTFCYHCITYCYFCIIYQFI